MAQIKNFKYCTVVRLREDGNPIAMSFDTDRAMARPIPHAIGFGRDEGPENHYSAALDLSLFQSLAL